MASAPILQVRPYGSTGNYTDLVPYLAFGGLKWSRNDIDASDAGRDQTGYLHRARVGLKVRLDGTCKPLLQEEATIVLQAIKPEWLEVRYFDIQEGSIVTKKMYSNNIPATFVIQRDATQYWEGIAFPLVEA